MTKKEIKIAIYEDMKMVWNDPDPIEGNDYTIHSISNLNDETCTIHYGTGENGMYSEAEVFLTEIDLK